MNDEPYQYVGTELEMFAAAKNWKQYVAQLIKPYINGNVLEAGAGIGNNTLLFFNDTVTKWVLLEPDINFEKQLKIILGENKFPECCTVFYGYTSEMKEAEQFDCILYIDVLEHIENDKAEMASATRLLKKGGNLVVLSPAYNYLMSPFDYAIGHYRRYTKKTLLTTANNDLQLEKIFYADIFGYFATMANKLFLKQKYPTKKQIHFWDNWLVPVSKKIDKIFFHKAGKSIIGIWKKK